MGKEVLLIVIGAIIGFVPSVCILIVERLFDFIGKIKIYYKFVLNEISQKSWGVYRLDPQKYIFQLPIVFEIQNTKNSIMVIRDINVEMYKGNKFVAKMEQTIKYKGTDVDDETQVTQFGAKNNSYSFILEPRSIQKINCMFMFDIEENETNNYNFDTLYLTYYDEKDKKVKHLLKKYLNGWNTKNTFPDKDWILVK